MTTRVGAVPSHIQQTVPIPGVREVLQHDLESLVASNPPATPSSTIGGVRSLSITDDAPHGRGNNTNPTSRPQPITRPAIVEPLTEEQIATNMDCLRQGSRPSLRMYCGSFDEIIHQDDLNTTGEDTVAEKVQLVLTDPPFNIRREQHRPNSGYDFLSTEEMVGVVDIITELLRPGGHAIIFCSIQQWPVWCELFKKADNSDGVTNTYWVSNLPLLLLAKPDVYSGFPGRRVGEQSGSLYAAHIRKGGVSQGVQDKMINSQKFHYVASRYPPGKHNIDNIPGLLPGEQIRVKKTAPEQTGGAGNENATGGGNGSPTGRRTVSTRALRPEQKSVHLLMELMSRFSQPGDIVVDLFSGTFSAALAAMLIPEHRLFVGCELESFCVQEASNNLYKRLAGIIHRKESDLVVSAEVRAACPLLKTRVPDKQVKDSSWIAPNGYPPYQCLPPHIVTAAARQTSDMSVFREYISAAVGHWPRDLLAGLNRCVVEDLVSLDMAAYNVYLSDSTIKHPGASLGVFSATSFQPGDVICTYYGTIIYRNLYETKEDGRCRQQQQ